MDARCLIGDSVALGLDGNYRCFVAVCIDHFEGCITANKSYAGAFIVNVIRCSVFASLERNCPHS